jgi:hypothetical protein
VAAVEAVGGNHAGHFDKVSNSSLGGWHCPSLDRDKLHLFFSMAIGRLGWLHAALNVNEGRLLVPLALTLQHAVTQSLE